MADNVVMINRAPVLTLWGAVVAERLGWDWECALTLGKAMAGLNAQSKGRALGIFGPPKATERGGEPKKTGLGEDLWVSLCGRRVPAKYVGEDDVRACLKDKPIEPAKVTKYLEGKFGEHLEAVTAAMRELAGSYDDPEGFAEAAYDLYTQFRPEIPRGKKGWGRKGPLDLELVRSLACQP
ncbi:MAG: hypothetical protein U9R79_19370 [Armatimonadota bacterium]|nr:hypothetical protein [Armatimonadota bacterium]